MGKKKAVQDPEDEPLETESGVFDKLCSRTKTTSLAAAAEISNGLLQLRPLEQFCDPIQFAVELTKKALAKHGPAEHSAYIRLGLLGALRCFDTNRDAFRDLSVLFARLTFDIAPAQAVVVDALNALSICVAMDQGEALFGDDRTSPGPLAAALLTLLAYAAPCSGSVRAKVLAKCPSSPIEPTGPSKRFLVSSPTSVATALSVVLSVGQAVGGIKSVALAAPRVIACFLPRAHAHKLLAMTPMSPMSDGAVDYASLEDYAQAAKGAHVVFAEHAIPAADQACDGALLAALADLAATIHSISPLPDLAAPPSLSPSCHSRAASDDEGDLLSICAKEGITKSESRRLKRQQRREKGGSICHSPTQSSAYYGDSQSVAESTARSGMGPDDLQERTSGGMETGGGAGAARALDLSSSTAAADSGRSGAPTSGGAAATGGGELDDNAPLVGGDFLSVGTGGQGNGPQSIAPQDSGPASPPIVGASASPDLRGAAPPLSPPTNAPLDPSAPASTSSSGVASGALAGPVRSPSGALAAVVGLPPQPDARPPRPVSVAGLVRNAMALPRVPPPRTPPQGTSPISEDVDVTRHGLAGRLEAASAGRRGDGSQVMVRRGISVLTGRPVGSTPAVVNDGEDAADTIERVVVGGMSLTLRFPLVPFYARLKAVLGGAIATWLFQDETLRRALRAPKDLPSASSVIAARQEGKRGTGRSIDRIRQTDDDVVKEKQRRTGKRREKASVKALGRRLCCAAAVSFSLWYRYVLVVVHVHCRKMVAGMDD